MRHHATSLRWPERACSSLELELQILVGCLVSAQNPVGGICNSKSHCVTEDIAQLVKCLPNVQKAMCLIRSTTKLVLVAHACNPSTWKMATGVSEVQGHPT